MDIASNIYVTGCIALPIEPCQQHPRFLSITSEMAPEAGGLRQSVSMRRRQAYRQVSKDRSRVTAESFHGPQPSGIREGDVEYGDAINQIRNRREG